MNVRKWNYRIDIKQHLDNYEDANLPLTQVANFIAKECEKIKILRDNDYPARLIEAGETDDIEEFDAVLEDLYDFSDVHRIRLGL